MGRGEGGSARVADVFFYRKAEPLYIYEGAWCSKGAQHKKRRRHRMASRLTIVKMRLRAL